MFLLEFFFQLPPPVGYSLLSKRESILAVRYILLLSLIIRGTYYFYLFWYSACTISFLSASKVGTRADATFNRAVISSVQRKIVVLNNISTLNWLPESFEKEIWLSRIVVTW